MNDILPEQDCVISEKVKKAVKHADGLLFVKVTSRNPRIMPVKNASKIFLFLTGDDKKPIELSISNVCSILGKDTFNTQDMWHNTCEQDTKKLCQEVANLLGKEIYHQTGFVQDNGLSALGPFIPE